MNALMTIILVIVELCSVIAAVHLWTHKPRPSLVSRCFWSLFLVMPIFGLVFYIFVRKAPEAHSDNSSGGASGWGGAI
jgi:uncharacterized membrane protein